jgi:hypothetical protein
MALVMAAMRPYISLLCGRGRGFSGISLSLIVGREKVCLLKSHIRNICFIIQNKPGADRVSRAGCGGASVLVCLFVGHVLIALRYRHDAVVGNRKSDYFGE